MRIVILTILLFTVYAATAQAPLNAVLIGPEGITITATTGTAVSYQFGTAGKFNTVTAPKYPLLVSCSSAAPCALLGGDPDPGIAKSIYAIQQTTAYTVTLAPGTMIQVPALPKPPLTVVSTYIISGPVTLTNYSDGSFILSGAGLTAVKK
jgi:hypothetical protein